MNIAQFQENAANAAIAAYDAGRKRYLIADETGLGKTIIARTIISKMAEHCVDRPFIVYYFGSNLMLLDNTISDKLLKDTVDWEYDDKAPKKLGMMAGRAHTKSGHVRVYGFSANLIGESGSKGDDDKERPYYEELVNRDKDNKFVSYVEECQRRGMISEKDKEEIKALWISEKKIGKDVSKLRLVLETFALETNPPDLIIFDEIHRYDDTLRLFLRRIGCIDLKLLLLSATPYNQYMKLEIEDDSAENEFDGRECNIRSFEDLLRILDSSLEPLQKYASYKKGEISGEDFSEYLKETCIYRNERLADGVEKYSTLPSAEDIVNHFKRCFSEEEELSKMESDKRYYKLCSGVWSFPVQTYNEKEMSYYSNFNFLNELLISDDDFYDEFFMYGRDHKLKRSGTYWDNLRFATIRHYNVEEGRDLLWVPPSKPEYILGGKYKESSFTKLMVFSAYKMVPRIVSGVFSSYVSDDVAVNTPIDLADIDNTMQTIWEDRLNSLAGLYDEILKKNDQMMTIEDLLKSLVEQIARENARLSEEQVLLTAKYIIGSPYMCSLRAYPREKAQELRNMFNAYFRKEGVKQAIAHNRITCSKQLLDYCVAGGLGAVLKEYSFAGGKVDNLERAIKYGVDEYNEVSFECSEVHVFSPDSFQEEETKSFVVKCHYAERFNADFTDTGASETSYNAKKHFENCQNAFNSPFWPMILCTTSANQEGYDLDRYCSRIMHYSLPANTMSFEQRDGRIDRRLSLLARRRMTQLYAKANCTWEEIFNHNQGECGMSPYWTQSGYIEECKRRKIVPLKLERIVPYFPMTSEHLVYRELLKMKNSYRGKFGLPNESNAGIDIQNMRLKLNDIT